MTVKLPKRIKVLVDSTTRLLSMALTLVLCYALVQMASQLRTSGEVTGVLHLPFFYIAYAMGIGFLIVAINLAREALELWRDSV